MKSLAQRHGDVSEETRNQAQAERPGDYIPSHSAGKEPLKVLHRPGREPESQPSGCSRRMKAAARRLQDPGGKALWHQALWFPYRPPLPVRRGSSLASLSPSFLLCRTGLLTTAWQGCLKFGRHSKSCFRLPAVGEPEKPQGPPATRGPPPPAPLTFSRPRRARTTQMREVRSS